VSAAHKTLPLGTKVRVTNLENGRELELTVNDRGPFVDGRIIDLSYASARLLGMADNGVAKVRVEGVSDNPAIATATVKTTAVASNDMPLRRPKAQVIERNIVEEPAARPQPLQAQAEPRAERMPAKAAASSSQKSAPNASRAESKTEVMAQAQAGKYAVQVGAFAQDDNARRVQAALVQSGYGNARITRVVRDGRDLHVVQAGSFAERERAEEALRSLKAQFPASFINSGA
jgi:rare lipoprotein A